MTQETSTTAGQQPEQNTPTNPPDPCKPTDGGGTPPVPPPQRKCDPLPAGPELPKLPEPKDECPENCCCPKKPGASDTCFDSLIEDQTKLLAAADRAKTFKTDLEDILKKAKAAKQDYTKAKFKDLSEKWAKQDGDIADLIAKLVCAVPCWRCVIECEICPLLYAIRDAELALNGDGTLTDKVYSLRDQRNWLERDRDAKKEVFDRIKAVLAAWDKPAQTIEKILADNAKLIEDTKKIIATDSVTAIYDVFMRLIPLALAIKPEGATSKIKAEYQDICCGDKGKPDTCCGPDVGQLSIRQGLLGPQPYLVDPDQLFDILCCLVNQRYKDAKEHLADAEAALIAIELKIKNKQSELDQKWASVAADFKAAVASPIDCDKYKSKGGGGCCDQTDPNKPAPTAA